MGSALVDQLRHRRSAKGRIAATILRQSGNIFFTLFGAVGLVGVVGASSMTIMKGPVKSMAEVTKRTVAENNMIASAKLSLIAATNQPDDGDCDGDGTLEPIVWSGTHPDGGGLLPSSIGAALQDPWGSTYRYCVWDHGAVRMGAGCGSSGRLAGNAAEDGLVLAIISSGPDRISQTTCANDAGGYVNKTPGSDDLVMSYTYAEAGAATGGIWRLRDGDPEVAEIAKNLSVKDDGGAEKMSFDANTGALALASGGTGSFPTVKTDFLGAFTNGNPVEMLTNIDLAGNWLSGDGDDEGIRINAAGNVGVNVAPTNGYEMQLHDPSNNRVDLQLTNNATGSAAGDGVVLSMTGNDVSLSNRENGLIRFNTNAETERMRITAGGNVGIGTTDPQATLHIVGNGAGGYRSMILSNTAANGVNKGSTIMGARKNNASTPFVVMGAWDQGTVRPVYIGGGGWSMPEATEIRFYAASAYDETAVTTGVNERMRITGAGNVGIGITNPDHSLHTAGNVRADGRYYYFGANQYMYGDNSSAWNLTANHSTITQLILRDAENTTYGRLYGSGDGVNFGLLDGDGNWGLLMSKDSYTRLQIDNSPEMTLYPAYMDLHMNQIRNVAEPTAAQHAATKNYVDTRLNEGSGGGVNADLLDGLDSTQFLRSDEADTATGIITFNNAIISDHSSGSYDVWLQGGPSGTSGTARNLALLGVTGDDTLRVNYGSEYTGGTIIGGPVTLAGNVNVTGTYTGAGDNLGLGGTTTGSLYSQNASGYGYLGSSSADYFRFDGGAGTNRILTRLGNTWMYITDTSTFRPYANNGASLGISGANWANLYATDITLAGYSIKNSWSGLRSQNGHGYIDLGPGNASWAHIYTDRPAFYFNKPIYINGTEVLTAGDNLGNHTATTNLNMGGYAITSSAGTIRDAGGGWVRTYNSTGWYNGTYGGGWYMTDSSYIRNYNSKGLMVTTGAGYASITGDNSGANYGVYGESQGTYGIYGKTRSASHGGVLGYSADGGTYGILGHANKYSLYGNGDIAVSGVVSAATFSGNGSSISNLNANNLTSGTIPNARLSGNYSGLGTVTANRFVTGDVSGDRWCRANASGVILCTQDEPGSSGPPEYCPVDRFIDSCTSSSPTLSNNSNGCSNVWFGVTVTLNYNGGWLPAGSSHTTSYCYMPDNCPCDTTQTRVRKVYSCSASGATAPFTGAKLNISGTTSGCTNVSCGSCGGGGGGDTSCFIAGTKITMADGSEKNIEELVRGDVVLGMDGAYNTVVKMEIPKLGQRPEGDRELYSINGGPFFVTSEHPFMLETGQWAAMKPYRTYQRQPRFKERYGEVKKLEVGDVIVRLNGEKEQIHKIESRDRYPDAMPVYNPTLDGNNTYYADGFLVHNRN